MELNEQNKRRIADSLYDLQDIVAEAIRQVADLGVENAEFESHLGAYEILVRHAEDALKEKYLFWQKRNENERRK